MPPLIAHLLSLLLFLLLCLPAATHADNIFLLGEQGESCAAACGKAGRHCNPAVPTNNSADVFRSLGVHCRADSRPWWAGEQPSFVSDPADPNAGDCLGWTDVPGNVLCQGSFHAVRRLCWCGNDNTADPFFGTGYSNGAISVNETTLFAHVVADGSYGVMDHFWVTAPPKVLDGAIFRYYVDGESTASIEFKAGLACGVGFNDDFAPWGTKWFGVGAGNGRGTAYTWNFNVPFSKSIRYTVQHESGTHGGFYTIVRGAKNKKINIGGFELPPTARLQLQKFDQVVQPLEFVSLVNVSAGPGLHFMSTLSLSSHSPNYIEGCFRAYTKSMPAFPGIVLGTGMEDYFDSGWSFDAGPFRLPVSGFTHFFANASYEERSAYRFHEQDPILFDDGFQLLWRNGDMLDSHTYLKCFTESGGIVVGSPTASAVQAYGWFYTWA